MADIDESAKFSSVVFIKNNVTGSSITIYPNPAKDKIAINVTEKALINSQASLSDVNGKVLQKISINQSSTEVNIGDYQKGIYILKFANGTAVKFIKE
jgi:hypothetical protein